MPFSVGSNPVTDLKLGPKQVNRLYLGSKLVWEKVTQAIGVTVRGATHKTVNSAASTEAVTPPAERQAGDLMIMVLTTYGTSASTVALPSGWTSMAVHARNTNHNVKVGYRIVQASGEPTTFTVTLRSGNTFHADVIAFAGVKTTALQTMSISTSSSTSGTHLTPSVTKSTSAGMLFALVSGGGGNNWDSPTSMTEIADNTTQSPYYLSMVIAVEATTGTGATGTRAFTDPALQTYSHTVAAVYIPALGT